VVLGRLRLAVVFLLVLPRPTLKVVVAGLLVQAPRRQLAAPLPRPQVQLPLVALPNPRFLVVRLALRLLVVPAAPLGLLDAPVVPLAQADLRRLHLGQVRLVLLVVVLAFPVLLVLLLRGVAAALCLLNHKRSLTTTSSILSSIPRRSPCSISSSQSAALLAHLSWSLGWRP